jgi:pimeloyl-ACP methyl ester carboxylesterase
MFSRLVRPVDLAVLDHPGVRLITFDRPGYGGTDPLAGATVTERAGDAIAVLDANGVARARSSAGQTACRTHSLSRRSHRIASSPSMPSMPWRLRSSTASNPTTR